eukprot:1643624-Pleurochrysis_carterae.AAC.1
MTQPLLSQLFGRCDGACCVRFARLLLLLQQRLARTPLGTLDLPFSHPPNPRFVLLERRLDLPLGNGDLGVVQPARNRLLCRLRRFEQVHAQLAGQAPTQCRHCQRGLSHR